MSNARGTKELLNYSYGKKLTLKQSVLAKCCECMGNYADGKEDCRVEDCPLYPYMVYGDAYLHRKKKIIPQNTLNALNKARRI